MFFDAERSRPRETPRQRAERLFKVNLPGGIIGAALALVAVELLGIAVGGVMQLAPCYGGEASRPWIVRMLGGMFFGLAFSAAFLALPTMLVGAVLGGFVAAFRARRASEPIRLSLPPGSVVCAESDRWFTRSPTAAPAPAPRPETPPSR